MTKLKLFIGLVASSCLLNFAVADDKNIFWAGWDGPKVCIEDLQNSCPGLNRISKDVRPRGDYSWMSPDDFDKTYGHGCHRAVRSFKACYREIMYCRSALKETSFWESKPICTKEMELIYGKRWNK